jgi:hypothetical protein
MIIPQKVGDFLQRYYNKRFAWQKQKGSDLNRFLFVGSSN